MNDSRVIKKYLNRRLYDSTQSRYVTLADVKKLVVDRVDFVVIEQKTQGDITRNILLQVIAELEKSGEPLMSRDFLSQVIRQRNNGAHDGVRHHPEQSLSRLSRHNLRL